MLFDGCLISGWVGKKNMRLLAVETSGRRERYRENGTMLGSCLPLGWTLVPFRLRLEWHLANILLYLYSCTASTPTSLTKRDEFGRLKI